MFKKYLSSALIILLINLAFGTTAFAGTKADKEAKFAAKVKNELAKLGAGTDARVEVKLRDKTKLKGYISQINENSFVVVEDNTNTPTEVSYSQTKQVKGNNLSTGAKIAIGVGIGVAVVFVVLFLLITDR
jgi:small nuclear ribonucleoprotein (snRNP)-like protein